MSEKKSGDFPTGSSGGGGKRGYDLGRLNRRCNSNDVDTGGESSGNKNNKEDEGLDKSKDFKIWIDQGEPGIQFNDIGNPQYKPLPVFDTLRDGTATPTHLRQNAQRAIINQPETDYSVGDASLQAVMGPSYMCMGNNNYQDIPSYGHQSINQLAPAYEQERAEGSAFRNKINENIQEARNEENVDFAGGQGRQDGNQDVGLQVPVFQPLHNVHLIHFTLTTLHAYMTNNGQVLCECLSLRDSHIFNFINTFNYVPYIIQICNNRLLAECIINHLKVVKALMSKDLQSAVFHQDMLVLTLNELLAEPQERGEQWILLVMESSRYELEIVKHKLEEEQRQAPGEVRYEWSFLHAEYCMEIGDCHCHFSQFIWTGQWYRR